MCKNIGGDGEEENISQNKWRNEDILNGQEVEQSRRWSANSTKQSIKEKERNTARNVELFAYI